MPDDSKTEVFISGLWDRMKERAAGMAAAYGGGMNTKKLTRDEEKLLFRARTDADGKPGISDEEAISHLQAGMSREAVGLLMYPRREKLAKSGGRLEPKDWIDYLNRLADEVEAEDRAGEAAQPIPAEQQMQSPMPLQAEPGAPPVDMPMSEGPGPTGIPMPPAPPQAPPTSGGY